MVKLNTAAKHSHSCVQRLSCEMNTSVKGDMCGNGTPGLAAPPPALEGLPVYPLVTIRTHNSVKTSHICATVAAHAMANLVEWIRSAAYRNNPYVLCVGMFSPQKRSFTLLRLDTHVTKRKGPRHLCMEHIICDVTGIAPPSSTDWRMAKEFYDQTSRRRSSKPLGADLAMACARVLNSQGGALVARVPRTRPPCYPTDPDMMLLLPREVTVMRAEALHNLLYEFLRQGVLQEHAPQVLYDTYIRQPDSSRIRSRYLNWDADVVLAASKVQRDTSGWMIKVGTWRLSAGPTMDVEKLPLLNVYIPQPSTHRSTEEEICESGYVDIDVGARKQEPCADDMDVDACLSGSEHSCGTNGDDDDDDDSGTSTEQTTSSNNHFLHFKSYRCAPHGGPSAGVCAVVVDSGIGALRMHSCVETSAAKRHCTSTPTNV